MAAQAGTAPTDRIALWDNARLVLIVLVVFGHLLESLRDDTAIKTVYRVLYSFHVPAFILVSGWFARSEPLDARALRGPLRLVVAWLAAEAGWALWRGLRGHRPFPEEFPVTQSWTLWFLVALAAMRILLPYVAQLRFPLAVAVVGALAAGLSSSIGLEYSASRILALLPFFVLGWWLRRAGLERAAWFRSPRRRVRAGAAGAALLTVLAVLALTRMPGFTDQLLFWRRSYEGEGYGDARGAVLRLAFLAIGAVLTLALLILLPRGSHWFSALGRNTLPVYLLHPPAVVALRRAHLDDAIAALPGAMGILLGLAVLATLVLASPPVAFLMRPVTHPDLVFRPLRS